MRLRQRLASRSTGIRCFLRRRLSVRRLARRGLRAVASRPSRRRHGRPRRCIGRRQRHGRRGGELAARGRVPGAGRVVAVCMALRDLVDRRPVWSPTRGRRRAARRRERVVRCRVAALASSGVRAQASAEHAWLVWRSAYLGTPALQLIDCHSVCIHVRTYNGSTRARTREVRDSSYCHTHAPRLVYTCGIQSP
jgi:hypothetical protein